MDDDLSRRDVGVTSGAAGGGAVAHNGRCARGQCAQRIGTTLPLGPWVLGTYCGGQLVKPTVQRRSVGGADRPPQFGQPVSGRTDLDVAILFGLAFGTNGVRVGVAHEPVDDLGDLVPRQGVPPGGVGGQPFVHSRQGVAVGDQSGPEHRRDDDAEIDLTGGEYRSQLRQPFEEFQAVVQLRRSAAATDSQFGPHLGGHRFPVVDAPLLAIVATCVVHPALTQPARSQQSLGDGRPFAALRVAHGPQQTRPSKSSNISSMVDEGCDRSI